MMLGTKKKRVLGRKSAETIASLLSQVNQLVTQGLRQSAIDLLEEAVSDSPNDTSLLSALGRVYLLDRQPEKAVIFLRRSLAESNSNPVYEHDYVPEAFTDADAEYLEEKAEEPSNDEFSFLGETDNTEPVNERLQENSSRTLHLNRNRPKRDEATTKNGSELQVTIIKRDWKRVETKPTLESEEESNSPDESHESGEANTTSKNEIVGANEALNSILDATPKSPPKPAAVPHILEVLSQPAATNPDAPYEGESREADEEFDLPDFESVNPEVVDVEDDFDDELDEIGPEIDLVENVPLYDDFISEDFGWEDLDDFEEEASRENEDEELARTGLTRVQRARQAAIDVLNRVGWNREYLPLLEITFVESGWGATRIAIEDQIEKGAVPEEIALARQIRSIWFNNQHLWTSFRMKSNAPFMQAEAVYKNFSWADALRLIRCFPSIPDGSEIEAFIDDMYDDWYSNDRLRRNFKAFLKYFRYRIVATKRTLPGDIDFLFCSPIEADWGCDNPELMSSISEMRAELRELGADSGFEMPGTDNKFQVLPKEAFDEDKESK